MMDGRGPLETDLDPIAAAKLRGAQDMLDAADGVAVLDDETRSAAEDRFRALGAPHRRDEYWRFTGPRRLAEPARTARSQPASTTFDDVDALTVEFEDGKLKTDFDALQDVDGLSIEPIEAADVSSIRVGALEAAAHERVPRPLAALNAARATGGLMLSISATVDRPIRIVSRGPGVLRHAVSVAPGASATLLEDRDGVGRSNTVIEATLAAGAALHHLRAQPDAVDAEDAAFLFADLGETASLKSFTLSAGAADGRHARNESVIALNGDGGSAHVAGASVVGGSAIVDQTVFLTHAAVGCESRQVFKNVLGGASTGVFQGKILVEQVAQKTDGYQISQSVLLDDRAAFQAKPELEIYADDVKCSHGSTTGAIDANALFYLMSRGVPRAVATRLLIEAFLEDAIVEIASDALQDVMRATAARWVGSAAA